MVKSYGILQYISTGFLIINGPSVSQKFVEKKITIIFYLYNSLWYLKKVL